MACWRLIKRFKVSSAFLRCSSSDTGFNSTIGTGADGIVGALAIFGEELEAEDEAWAGADLLAEEVVEGFVVESDFVVVSESRGRFLGFSLIVFLHSTQVQWMK
jgi:hypothetical protein